MTAVDDLIMMINERAEALRPQRESAVLGAIRLHVRLIVRFSRSRKSRTQLPVLVHAIENRVSRAGSGARTVSYENRRAVRAQTQASDVSPAGPVGRVDSS